MGDWSLLGVVKWVKNTGLKQEVAHCPQRTELMSVLGGNEGSVPVWVHSDSDDVIAEL